MGRLSSTMGSLCPITTIMTAKITLGSDWLAQHSRGKRVNRAINSTKSTHSAGVGNRPVCFALMIDAVDADLEMTRLPSTYSSNWFAILAT